MLPQEFEAAYMAASLEDKEVIRQIAGDWCEERADLANAELCRGKAPIPLVWCPSGSFLMGSPENELGRDDDEDQVNVTLSQGYWLGKYPVTQGQWREVMGDLPGSAGYGKGPNHPVYYVNWDESQEFCTRYTESERQAGRLTYGWAYRLPTEAEWECACRAGSTTRFCFGDDEAKLGDYAWYDENSKGQTHEVGQKKPNAWGLCDMHGNVWEWCCDWYVGKYRPQEWSRVYRGGCFSFDALGSRSAIRAYYYPKYKCRSLGFRLAMISLMSE